MADARALRWALAQGKAAAAAGRPVTVCGYPPGTLRELFVRGYVAGRQPEPAALIGRPGSRHASAR